jgi:type II secretory pathway component PulM
MLSADISPAEQAVLLIMIVVLLAACFVWLFWEAEYAKDVRRQKQVIVSRARRFMVD